MKDSEGLYRTEAGERVELIKEKNYVFNITTEIKDKIRTWASSPQNPITPQSILNKIL